MLIFTFQESTGFTVIRIFNFEPKNMSKIHLLSHPLSLVGYWHWQWKEHQLFSVPNYNGFCHNWYSFPKEQCLSGQSTKVLDWISTAFGIRSTLNSIRWVNRGDFFNSFMTTYAQTYNCINPFTYINLQRTKYRVSPQLQRINYVQSNYTGKWNLTIGLKNYDVTVLAVVSFTLWYLV